MFKVGDWVRYKSSYAKNTKPLKVHDCTGTQFISSSGNAIECDAVELWQPRKNEWCWFYDKDMLEYKIPPYLARFDSYVKFNDGKELYKTLDKLPNGCMGTSLCEPYTNKLPTYLKD